MTINDLAETAFTSLSLKHINDDDRGQILAVLRMALILQDAQYAEQLAAMDNDIRTERAVAEKLIREGVKRGNMFDRGEMASEPVTDESALPAEPPYYAEMSKLRMERDAALAGIATLKAQRITWDGNGVTINGMQSPVPVHALEKLMRAIEGSTVFVSTQDYNDCMMWLARLQGKEPHGMVKLRDMT